MTPRDTDSCLYTRYKGNDLELIVMIYVVDKLPMTRNSATLREENKEVDRRFEIKDMGP